LKEPKSAGFVLAPGEAPDPIGKIDRQGIFPQRADILSLVVSQGIGHSLRGLQIAVHIGEPMRLTATNGKSKCWTMAFKQEPDGKTEVTLENVTATPEELDQIWSIVAQAARLG
jgi:hypothetical protein